MSHTDRSQATGQLGKNFAQELVEAGKFKITAIVRADSKGTLPQGLTKAPVNFDDEASLMTVLKGQHFLIITLAATAPAGVHHKIVKAAAKAGVPYIMPDALPL